MPRPGTTIIEQILANDPLVFGAGELDIFRKFIHVICKNIDSSMYPECILSLGIDAFKRRCAGYIEEIKKFLIKRNI